MSGLSLLVVFGGAGCGALLRWWLGGLLNPVFPTLPLGTLAANLVGGLLVGAASAYFTQHGALPPEWRLLVITGFLGGLTTFSTFSLEVVTFSAAGPPLAPLNLMPKSPSGPPGLWLADRMSPPKAPCWRITQLAAGVDRMPPCPTSTRPKPFAAAMRMTVWMACRL